MNQEHPITPSPELVREWTQYQGFESPEILWQQIAHQAARWGADMELEACCEWVESESCLTNSVMAKRLRAARRPKPPSLKEQALMLLEPIGRPYAKPDAWKSLRPEEVDIIRRALESLPEFFS